MCAKQQNIPAFIILIPLSLSYWQISQLLTNILDYNFISKSSFFLKKKNTYQTTNIQNFFFLASNNSYCLAFPYLLLGIFVKQKISIHWTENSLFQRRLKNDLFCSSPLLCPIPTHPNITTTPIPETTASATPSSQHRTALIPIQAKSQAARNDLCTAAQLTFPQTFLVDACSLNPAGWEQTRWSTENRTATRTGPTQAGDVRQAAEGHP